MASLRMFGYSATGDRILWRMHVVKSLLLRVTVLQQNTAAASGEGFSRSRSHSWWFRCYFPVLELVEEPEQRGPAEFESGRAEFESV